MNYIQAIKRLLKSQMTSYALAKETGLSTQFIDNYRTGKSKVENMALGKAEVLVSYLKFINQYKNFTLYPTDYQQMINSIKKRAESLELDDEVSSHGYYVLHAHSGAFGTTVGINYENPDYSDNYYISMDPHEWVHYDITDEMVKKELDTALKLFDDFLEERKEADREFQEWKEIERNNGFSKY